MNRRTGRLLGTTMRLVAMVLLMVGLAGCGANSTLDDGREVRLMEETRVAIENLKGRMDLDYPATAQVWNGTIRVIVFHVEDPTTDYRATVEEVVEALDLDLDQGQWMLAFTTDKKREDGKWVPGEPNSTLQLEQYDAVTGEEVE